MPTNPRSVNLLFGERLAISMSGKNSCGLRGSGVVYGGALLHLTLRLVVPKRRWSTIESELPRGHPLLVEDSSKPHFMVVVGIHYVPGSKQPPDLIINNPAILNGARTLFGLSHFITA
jgi:hypothetical protein